MTTTSLLEDARSRWFYEDADHQQSGPVTFAALHSFLLLGIITFDTPVRPEGENQWKLFGTLFTGEIVADLLKVARQDEEVRKRKTPSQER